MERDRLKFIGIYIGIGLLIGIVLPVSVIGGSSVSPEIHTERIQQSSGQMRTNITVVDRNVINATIPADDTEGVSAINVSIDVTRSLAANPVFNYNINDAELFRYSTSNLGWRPMLVVDLDGPLVFISATNDTTPVSANEWIPLHQPTGAARDRPTSNSIDTVTITGNRDVIAYSDQHVYALFKKGAATIPFAEDPGVYFDGNTYHMYYESGNTSGPSGTKIGYASSSNAALNWNKRGAVYSTSNGYESGDYHMVQKNGVYFLFGDYTKNHPEYNVSVWVNDDPATKFTRVGNILKPVNTERGIQDVTVQYDEQRGKYVFYAQVHKPSGDELHYALGEIRVEKQG